MRKILLGSLLILSVLNTGISAQAVKPVPKPADTATANAKQADSVPFVNKVLPNGLEVIVLPDKSVPIVTVELDVRNGSFTEPPELNGLSHLYEHMFFKPNQAALLRECESYISSKQPETDAFRRICSNPLKLKPQIGSLAYLDDRDQLDIYNGTTREEVVNYFYTTTSPYLSGALRLINDSVRYPTFDEQDLTEEKQVVIGELDRHESNPFYYLDQTMKERLFYKYPTRKMPAGTRQTVAAATTDQMRLIQSRYYVPNNSAIIVTGDVNPEEVFKITEQIFGSWEKSKTDPFKDFPLVEHPPLPKSEGVIVEQPVQNVLINIGWHGPSIGKDDAATYAADVFSYILTQPDSRFQRAMVDSGLTVGAGISYYTQRNVGPISIVLQTSPDKAKAALNAVYKEVAQFDKPDYFTDEELQNAKTILESNDLFEREKLSEYAHTLGFWWSSTGIDYFRGYYKNLRATSRTDINRYVKNYIQDKPHVGVALISADAQGQAKITPQDLIGK